MQVGLNTDRPYWVSREAFFKYFDQADFHCRDVENVTSSYLSDWFDVWRDGIRRFKVPAVYFVTTSADTRTEFVSGRHRTAVLLRFLDKVPLSFTPTVDKNPAFFSRLVIRPIEADELFSLPDLPICEKLP
jgi:hypothetical protein